MNEWHIDATYKIISHNRNLIIISIKLNDLDEYIDDRMLDLNEDQLENIKLSIHRNIFPILVISTPNERTETITPIISSFVRWYGKEPLAFIMDCQKSFLNAVKSALPNTTIYWCIFHVLRAIFNRLKTIVISDDDKPLHDAIKNKIWLISMVIKSKEEANDIINDIIEELNANEKYDFLHYLQDNYFNEDILPLWLYSYRSNFSRTSNISESLNNVLKNRYCLKFNQRSDNFLSYLINVVLPDFIFEGQYALQNKVGSIQKMPQDQVKFNREKEKIDNIIYKLRKFMNETNAGTRRNIIDQINKIIFMNEE